MSAASTAYTASFYNRQQAGSSRSAALVLPIVFDAVRPKSIIDIGCGVGTWLRSARRLGVERAVGVDGEWVRGAAVDPSLDIRHAHLEGPITLNERFDLALCLEVAEHLSPKRGRTFVADLTRLAPYVLFSAAIPGQGGHHHLNEQWQSYWAELFANEGYGALDIVRPKVRWRPGVEFWYRQNAILYSREAPIVPPASLDLVHPLQRVAWRVNGVRRRLRPSAGISGTGRTRRSH